MRTGLDVRRLEHFLGLLEHGSFRAAAEALGLSQSALSKSLKQLETSLGLRLFDRTTRSVVPTDAALALRARAEESLGALEAVRREARLLAAGSRARLRVSVVALAADSLLPRALARLAARHPQLEVDVTVGSADVYGDLVAGACDVVVGDEDNVQLSAFAGSLRVAQLQVEQLVAVFRADHPCASAPRLAQLLMHPWAIPSRYFTENSSLGALAERISTPGFPRYRMTSLSACLALAAQSEVVTLAPVSVVQGPAGQGLAHHPLGLDMRVRFALFTLARVAVTPAVRAFQQAVSGAGSPAPV